MTEANRFECAACGWVSIPPPHLDIAVVFHPCRPRRRRRRLVRLPEVVDTLEDARSELWHGFADSLPGEALLRPIEEEQ